MWKLIKLIHTKEILPKIVQNKIDIYKSDILLVFLIDFMFIMYVTYSNESDSTNY